jgi:agmatinase
MSHFPVSDIVRSPGGGLLSFTTGSGKAFDLLGHYFGEENLKNWQPILQERLQDQSLPFSFVGIPSDCGGGICRGAAHGPMHMRHKLYARSPELAQYDLGDVPCIPHLLHDVMLSERQQDLSGETLWGDNYKKGYPVAPLNLLEEFLVEAYAKNPSFKPFVMGGDHSISGPIFEALNRVGKLDDLAVIHFDAHTDLLESRYGVENCFATWTAHAIKHLPDPKRLVQLGIRASGFSKEHWEAEYGLQQYWAKDLQPTDPTEFAHQLIENFKQLGCSKLYITNDIDGTDSKYAPSTGTPEGNGLTPEWVNTVIRICSTELELIGADINEVAPVLGSKEDIDLTLEAAINIIEAHQWR